MSEEIKTMMDAYFSELFKVLDGNRDNAAWLRFAEAAIGILNYGDIGEEFREKVSQRCADFADAMVAEAKKRGRV